MNYSRSLLAFLNKRYLSVLKKCALINACLLVLSAPAWAVEGATFADLNNALAKGENFTFVENLVATEDLNGYKNIATYTINGNGYTLDGANLGGFNVNNGSLKLTIENLTVENFSSALLVNGGSTVTFSGQFLNNNKAVRVIGDTSNFIIDAKQKTVFEGNQVGIHTSNGGTATFYASAADIDFHDTIEGNGYLVFKGEGNNKIYLRNSVGATNATIESGTVVLADKGTFSGPLKLSGGTLDIGANKVTLSKVTFDAASTLALAINADSYGSLSASTWDVVKGANLLATLAAGVVTDSDNNKEFDLLKGGNISVDIAKKFAPEISNNNNMYDFVASEDKAGTFIITKTGSGSNVSEETGGTTTNGSAAEAWVDSGKAFPTGSASADLAEKLHQLAQTSKNGEFNAALTALAPEVSPVVSLVSTQILNQVFSAVSARMTSGGIYEPAEGLSAGEDLYEQVATWVQVLTNKSKLKDSAKAYGFDVDTNGVAMGLEKEFNALYKAGVGYAYSNSDVDAFLRDTNVEAHTFFAYGEYKFSRWFVNGIAAYTFSHFDENKNVAGGNYRAKYDVDSLGLQIMGGYDALINDVNVTPEVGFRYSRIDRNSYTDAAGQSVSSKKMDVLTAVVGTKVSKDFVTCNGTHWKPEARLALTYDIVSDKDNALVSLPNGASYMVDGERLKRFGVEAGAGIVIDVNDQIETRIGYEGKFRDKYTDHSGLLNFKYKF